MDTRGLGAFALRDLAAGELLLEEEPFYIRMPPQQLQGRPEWDAAWVAAFNGIRKSLVAPKGSSFEGMPEKPLLVRSLDPKASGMEQVALRDSKVRFSVGRESLRPARRWFETY